jgi:leader peptidase (prepilin peptidase)/N-methyltransferase
MGLGDVHILAAVGAVCGWVVPSITFFMAAFLALAWAMTVFVTRKQRELPYGPWLAAGALVTMVFYDYLRELLGPYAEVLKVLSGG